MKEASINMGKPLMEWENYWEARTFLKLELKESFNTAYRKSKEFS